MKRNSSKKSNRKFINSHFDWLIVLVIALVTAALSFTSIFENLELRAYDFLCHLKKSPAESELIEFIQVDDDSVSSVGRWPWNRNIFGDVLIRLKEMGAGQAVFDIEYVEDAPRTVNENLEELAQSSIRENGAYIEDSIKTYAQNISSGKIRSGQAVEESEKLIEDEIYPALYEINRVLGNNIYNDTDDYFSRCIQFFENTYLTVNVQDIGIQRFKNDDKDEEEYSRNRFLLKNVTDEKYLIARGNAASLKYSDSSQPKSFVPPIKKIVKGAKRIGFTNVVVDKDGTRRRIELLNEQSGLYAPQLAFGPLCDLLEVESFERKGKYLILHNAKLPGQTLREDIKIPLDSRGRMLINWSHEKYTESFGHIPAYQFTVLDNLEAAVYKFMKNLSVNRLSEFSQEDADYIRNIGYFADEYEGISKEKLRLLQKCRGYDENNNPVRGGIKPEDYTEYFSQRKEFFTNLKTFTDSFNTIPDWEKNVQLVNLTKALESYLALEQQLKLFVNGKICLFGVTASSSTDLGVTPFERRYPNLGTHGNVINTIVQKDFILPLSEFIGLAFAFLIALLVVLCSVKLSPSAKNITGIIFLIVPPLTLILLMLFANIYIPVVLTIFYAALCYISLMIKNFAVLEKERQMLQQQKEDIQNAFGKALAKEVVDEIVKHPEMMEPGGFDYNMSAIFTDIQKFSGFSEFLSAGELVQLLNYYLNKMADFIIHEKGIVDKYEGDAIVAFVGAPFEIKDHAERACRAAINMKNYEKQMNDEIYSIASDSEENAKLRIDKIFGGMIAAGNMEKEKAELYEKKVSDLYSSFKKMVENERTIFTRIGINSGDMVAGFMGSENKLNYTMMGNNVNLASRLEGVNKQYRTNGILIHEQTRNMLDNKFVVRRLDRVRVVNVNTPIRLYELLTMKEFADENFLKYVGAWEKVMDAFEHKEYAKALAGFKKLADYKKDDNVAKYYVELIENFFIKGKYPLKADNVGVEYNPKDGVFTLLQK